jgi:hypothetical protein
VGVVGLEVEKSEDGDRVVMEDPEVLAPRRAAIFGGGSCA